MTTFPGSPKLLKVAGIGLLAGALARAGRSKT